MTRELYAGFDRNYSALVNGDPPYILYQDYYERPGIVIEYVDDGDHQNHFVYLHGNWMNGVESIIHARPTEDYEDYIALRFYAREVNAVMSLIDGSTPYQVRLTLGEGPVPTEAAGIDVAYDEEGNSFVFVDSSRMYNLVNPRRFGGYELKLSSNSADFALFAFTFGAYEDTDGP